jgi:CBS domain-containing protein
MTRDVVSLHPDTPVRQIARVLLDNHISAAPVVDSDGRPIGIVSEGDLVTRSEGERETRRDWWISLLAEGEHLSEDFVNYIRADRRMAHQIMSAPVVTVGEDTSIDEIAQILSSYRIKRVPVLAHRRMVGIVSRADLVGALSGVNRPSLPRQDSRPRPTVVAATVAQGPTASPGQASLSADHFRDLVADHEIAEAQKRAMEHLVYARRRHEAVSALIKTHIADDTWQSTMQEAARAAASGEKDFLLLRFPSELCRDGGRAINAPEEDWPSSLRGEAAEIYLRWERDLKPCGFHITARVLDFPDGLPGDIGLFLVWGERR